jgi:hypothetical protein
MNRSFAADLNRVRREDGIFLALMLALFALRFWSELTQEQLYAPFQDNLWLYGPLFSRASEIALTGNFPYWLDTVLGGLPDAAFLGDLPLLFLRRAQLWQCARGALHAKPCHVSAYSHFVSKSLCLAANCRS